MSRPTNIGIRLRNLLLANPDGMTTRDLSKIDGTPQDIVMSALERNYGFYVGGWEKAAAGKYRAVWKCVVVPASAPKPMEYAECYDKEEASIQRQRENYKEINAQLIVERRKARIELKAQREREKVEAKQRKAESKALREQAKAEERAEAVRKKELKRISQHMEPAAPAGYKPAKTVWVTPPPWSH